MSNSETPKDHLPESALTDSLSEAFLASREQSSDQDSRLEPAHAAGPGAIKEQQAPSSIETTAESSEQPRAKVDFASLPAEMKRWNWGAFFLTFVWGAYHQTYISLLGMLPGLSLIMPFVLGGKGNEWAWQNRDWNSIEHFQSVQRKWAIAGSAAALLAVGIPVGTALFVLDKLSNTLHGFFDSRSIDKQMERPIAYTLTALDQNRQASSLLGLPYQKPTSGVGTVDTTTHTGEVSIPLTGSLRNAVLYIRAKQSPTAPDSWVPTKAILDIDKASGHPAGRTR